MTKRTSSRNSDSVSFKCPKKGGIDISNLQKLNFLSKNKNKLNKFRQKKTEKCSALGFFEKNKYILYPTGGLHPSRKYHSLGKVFPFIYSTKKDLPMCIRLSRCAYPSISLPTPEILMKRNGHYKNTKKIDFIVHELFAIAFIKNKKPECCWVVDHQDEDKMNYQIKNLKWITAGQNHKKALKTKLKKQLK